MRTGPVLVLAGIGLFVAALLATGHDAFEPPDLSKTERRALGDAGELDIGRSQLGQILLTGRDDVELRHSLRPWRAGGEQGETAPAVAWAEQGGVLRLTGRLEASNAYEGTLEVPARIRAMRGDSLQLDARVPVDRLLLEGNTVSWSGQVRELDVHLRRSDARDCIAGTPTFSLGVATIGVLRIHAMEGAIDLGPLDGAATVGLVEIHAGPRVELQRVAVGKLPEIRMLPPTPGTPAVPPSPRTPGDPRHATSTRPADDAAAAAVEAARLAAGC